MKLFFTTIILFVSFLSQGQNIYFIKSYGNNGYDYGRDIKQDIDTGYIVTGSSSSFNNSNGQAFLLKVDSLGNFLWSNAYGGPEAEWGESVVVTSDNGYALGGYTNSYGAGGFDFYVVKTDGNGNALWENTYGGSDWDRAHSLIQLPDSGYVIAGETYSYGNGNMDVYIVRTDKNGDTLWTRTFGGTEDDFANAVMLDGDSLIVAGGTSSFSNGMTDGLILKYHIDGTLGWYKTAGKDKEDYFTSVDIRSASQRYYFGGTRDYHHDSNCDCGQEFWVYIINQFGGNLIADTARIGVQPGAEIIHDIEIVGTNNDIIYGGSTSTWGSNTDLSPETPNAFIGKITGLNYYVASYINNFGVDGADVIYGLDFCYDDGIVGVGQLAYNATGGMNTVIVKIDKNNTPGSYSVINSITSNENITLSYNSFAEKSKINVYPTLFTELITITGLPTEHSIEIYNTNGKLVYRSINSSNSIDLQELSKGIYILNIITSQGNVTTKIIKQ
jgi:hypothetical protein